MRSRDELAKGKFGAPYTTNYVLDETITLLRARASFESSLKFKEKVEKTEVMRIVWVGEELTAEANEIFKTHPELRLSFTDSTSFVVMQQLGIRLALAFDKDFQAFGFQVVSQKVKVDLKQHSYSLRRVWGSHKLGAECSDPSESVIY